MYPLLVGLGYISTTRKPENQNQGGPLRYSYVLRSTCSKVKVIMYLIPGSGVLFFSTRDVRRVGIIVLRRWQDVFLAPGQSREWRTSTAGR